MTVDRAIPPAPALDPPVPPGPPHPPESLARRGTRLVGELLLTAGALVVLFIVYQLWVTNLFAAQDQHRLHNELAQVWNPPAAPAPEAGAPTPAPRRSAAPGIPAVRLGHGLAVLRIPRFGRGYDPVVVEGVSTGDLQEGPGHIPGTALPGAVGNFAVSGHRTTYGHPFGRLDELRVGDPIVVEVADRYYTYRVTAKMVVDPSATSVILPVPGRPGLAPTQRLLTFTTCTPEFSAAQRLVIHAQLIGTELKSRGVPAVLTAKGG